MGSRQLGTGRGGGLLLDERHRRPGGGDAHGRRGASRAGAVLVLAALCLLATPLSRADASPGMYDSARAPGVHVSVDCAKGTGFVEVENQDMSGSAIEVTIDGRRDADLHVDDSGHLQAWYALMPDQPHRLTIVFDFVPGGTDEEEDQVLTASCLDNAPIKTPGAMFNPVSPTRLWDSRFGPGPIGHVGAGQPRQVTVTGVAGIPATGVTAVVLNVTAVNPSATTHVTAWPTGETKPLASNLNLPAGDTRPNLVVVKVGTNGTVTFDHAAGNLDLIADIAGFYG